MSFKHLLIFTVGVMIKEWIGEQKFEFKDYFITLINSEIGNPAHLAHCHMRNELSKNVNHENRNSTIFDALLVCDAYRENQMGQLYDHCCEYLLRKGYIDMVSIVESTLKV